MIVCSIEVVLCALPLIYVVLYSHASLHMCVCVCVCACVRADCGSAGNGAVPLSTIPGCARGCHGCLCSSIRLNGAVLRAVRCLACVKPRLPERLSSDALRVVAFGVHVMLAVPVVATVVEGRDARVSVGRGHGQPGVLPRPQKALACTVRSEPDGSSEKDRSRGNDRLRASLGDVTRRGVRT